MPVVSPQIPLLRKLYRYTTLGMVSVSTLAPLTQEEAEEQEQSSVSSPEEVTIIKREHEGKRHIYTVKISDSHYVKNPFRFEVGVDDTGKIVVE